MASMSTRKPYKRDSFYSCILAGVERLSNSARDIYHYNRGSLKPKSIEDHMMMMCTTRFDMVLEKLTFIGEYLSTRSIHARKRIRLRKERNGCFI